MYAVKKTYKVTFSSKYRIIQAFLYSLSKETLSQVKKHKLNHRYFSPANLNGRLKPVEAPGLWDLDFLWEPGHQILNHNSITHCEEGQNVWDEFTFFGLKWQLLCRGHYFVNVKIFIKNVNNKNESYILNTSQNSSHLTISWIFFRRKRHTELSNLEPN